MAALPRGTLTQQPGLPRHQHNATGCECVYVRSTHLHTAFSAEQKHILMQMQIRGHSLTAVEPGGELHWGNVHR